MTASAGRILLFTEYASARGGAESYLAALTAALTQSGWRVAVVCGSPIDGDGFAGAERTVRIDGLTSAERRTPEMDIQLDRVISEFQPDLAHFHLVSMPPYVRRLSARVPTVYSIHNHFLTCPSGTRLLHSPDERCSLQPGPMCVVNAYVRRCNSRRPGVVASGLRRTFANRRAVGSIRRFIVHGPFMRDTLRAGGIPEERISIIPPLPAEEYTQGGTMDSDPLFLFAGRLAEEKGLHVAIEGLATIPKARLVVAGEGYYQSKLEQRARDLGVAARVSFVGRVDRRALVELYRRAWAVVVPSVWPEPFGLTGLEAMACARAVVAFDTGDIKAWLEDGITGRLVPWNSHSRFRDGMAEFTDRNVAHRLGQNAFHQFERNFSAPRHNASLEDVYRQVLHSTGANLH